MRKREKKLEGEEEKGKKCCTTDFPFVQQLAREEAFAF